MDVEKSPLTNKFVVYFINLFEMAIAGKGAITTNKHELF